jgi:hypothetical protein
LQIRYLAAKKISKSPLSGANPRTRVKAVPGVDHEDEPEQEELEAMLDQRNFDRAAAILRKHALQLKGLR